MTERHRRRQPREVRALLLDSAARVFASKGFRGASTAEIAKTAGVSESALFRHFETKVDLFTAAAAEPFVEFIDAFGNKWANQPAAGRRAGTLMQEFVTELYDTVSANRAIVQALLIADPSEAPFQGAFTRIYSRLQSIGESWSRDQGLTIPGIERNERMLMGMITSLVLFDRWFLCDERGEPLPRSAAIEALVDFAHHGAVQRDRIVPRE